MCELMGMSANVPTDICFSFAGLIKRGGETGPNKDGWGIAFYEGKGVREFKDVDASSTSELAHFVRRFPIKSHVVISHIRQANSGPVALENTHPFQRELWGKTWVFAHNGQLKNGVRKQKLSRYRPVGSTDSEFALCYILDQLQKQFTRYPAKGALFSALHEHCLYLSKFGVFNILLSDSKYLYCYCTTKLGWICRRSPFGQARLKDHDMVVNFSDQTTPDDVVTVIATEPLTDNEDWTPIQPGELLVFHKGVVSGKISAASTQ